MKFNRRDSVEAEIVTALTKAGCDIDYAERKPYDILCGRGGVTFVLEFKSKGGKLTQAQIDFRKSWRGHYAVVRSAREALTAVGL